ncbi:DUF559 domain-containing protein [Candidatus Phycosocius spiralis]|uniref:DUF559 domain-containing protein n=1 Tax=Candidatus Phycosocius spiralis TaxID=2815099 RepID=UPI003B967AFE
MFWQRVRNRQIGGLKLRRQVAIHGFVVTFACLSNRLVIEIDGGIHSLGAVQRAMKLVTQSSRPLAFR